MLLVSLLLPNGLRQPLPWQYELSGLGKNVALDYFFKGADGKSTTNFGGFVTLFSAVINLPSPAPISSPGVNGALGRSTIGLITEWHGWEVCKLLRDSGKRLIPSTTNTSSTDIFSGYALSLVH